MNNPRITSGSAKGKKLEVPEIPGFRAVQDKAKLAIFSILQDKVIDAKCLDLYAGSGNLGLEALSRGASHCDFVEKTRVGELTLIDNLRNTGFTDKGNVHRQDVIKYVGNSVDYYDIIFADPFYKDTHFRFLFQNMEEILRDEGVIVFSHGEDTDIKDALTNTQNLEIYDTKRYGSAFITVLRKN
jgi:16S rRNA (guanine966-N2)-methyltransferase